MPSSTSSSEPTSADRAPRERLGRSWALALALVLLTLGGLEVTARADGWTPTYRDTAAFWAHWRGQVYGDDVVVLLGSSRTLLGLDPEAMHREDPSLRFVQLAIDGSGSPIALLEDLADDEDFTGKVIFELYPSPFFASRGWEDGERVAAEHIDHYRDQGFVEPLETRLRLALQGSLVILRRELTLTSLVFSVLKRRALPERDFIEVRRSRFQAADYSAKEQPPKTWILEPDTIATPAARRAKAAHVAELARRIEQRGGAVLFFRTISSGYVRDLERRYLPRARFYDAFVAQTGVRALHFEDVPGLRRFTCPDGRHLDRSDAEVYSRELARALVARGWL